MGDVSVIARRLSNKYVQYGWSGNGGYFSTVGARLLAWYNTPEMVEYLFGLGQLRHLWRPGSEEQNSIGFRTLPTGSPHWTGTSEQEIFSRILFVDYGYFYDADNTWYYVKPGPFCLKIPLKMVCANFDKKEAEFPFLDKAEQQALEIIFSERFADCLRQSGLDAGTLRKIHERLREESSPLYVLGTQYRRAADCFEDWILVRPDRSGKGIGEIVLHPKEDPCVETIFW